MCERIAVNGFDKGKRLLKASDYQRVFAAPDRRASHRCVLLLARPNQQPYHRLGLVIAKRHVKHAVQRNRVKRQAREFFRRLPSAPVCLDVVLLARSGLDQLDNQELSSILRQQWQKLQNQA
ncbi:MAG: ribonuclease P protein component [Pseudomonadota bacterium]